MKLAEIIHPGMKGVFYGRHSTDKQEMVMQQHSVANLMAKYGCYIVEEYLDAGVSAVKKNLHQRKQLQRLINDASSNKFDFVVVYKGDRLARDPIEHHFIRTTMELYDIPIIESSTESLYTHGENIIVQLLQDGLSKFEADNIRQRTRNGLESRAQKGYWTGGNAPFGYRYDKKTHQFIPYPEELEIVKQIFDLYKKAEGFDSISKRLSQTTSNGKEWTKEKVKRIVTNPFYSGYLAWGKTKPDSKNSLSDRETWIYAKCDFIEPVISKEDWEFCWKLYQQKRKRKVSPKYYKTSFLLKDLVYCRNCNQLLDCKNQQTTGNNGKKYGDKIYFCSSCQLRIEADILHGIIDSLLNDIRTNQPEQIFLGVMKGIYKDIQKIESEITELEFALGTYSIQSNQVKDEIQSRLKQELSNQNKKMLNIMTTYRLSLKNRLEQTEIQINDKRKQIEQLKQVDAAKESWNIILQDAFNNRDDINLSDLRRLLIHLVSTITVDKELRIEYQLRHNLIKQKSNNQLELLF
ncbi:recombinase family protein [Schinkia azotoformans]|uniref:recombinase family protein n=1 Tax=Schinkia azotoformans TaxID=1454 RepID=UPI002E23FA83|nr:recombinase family protein [Schinkia azotoformans]MED4354317.1 recombinase family protein [Schinkia azotoformans]